MLIGNKINITLTFEGSEKTEVLMKFVVLLCVYEEYEDKRKTFGLKETNPRILTDKVIKIS